MKLINNTSALFSCGFRPFFLLASIYAIVLIFFWVLFWNGVMILPETLGGPVAWHVYEMLYGFMLAVMLGFISTAIYEFVSFTGISRQQLMALVLLWLLGRISFWLSGIVGLIPAAVFNLTLLMYLLVLLTPSLWRDPGRPHMSFIYTFVGLLLIECGFYYSALTGQAVMPWLYTSIGLSMIMIIIAMSRISMRVINGMEEGVQLFKQDVEYLARPPRRKIAIFTIALFSLAELIMPGNLINGWLALAAAAAMLNLLNDWHIGRPLFNPWVFSMYAVYWLMASGYLFIGLSILSDVPEINGARHLLTTGAMGLAIFIIMTFSGQVHTGYGVNYRPWILISTLAILVATLSRVLIAWPTMMEHSASLILISSIAWMLAFSLFIIFFWRLLTGAAIDGREGCLD